MKRSGSLFGWLAGLALLGQLGRPAWAAGYAPSPSPLVVQTGIAAITPSPTSAVRSGTEIAVKAMITYRVSSTWRKGVPGSVIGADFGTLRLVALDQDGHPLPVAGRAIRISKLHGVQRLVARVEVPSTATALTLIPTILPGPASEPGSQISRFASVSYALRGAMPLSFERRMGGATRPPDPLRLRWHR